MKVDYMEWALDQAKRAYELGEVPVGAVMVKDEAFIAAAHNAKESTNDPTAHAEILCLRQAAQSLRTWRLEGCWLYVTLEPCAMCLAAIIEARLAGLVFGAWDERWGACGGKVELVRELGYGNHPLEIVGGRREPECRQLLERFFAERRTALEESSS